ncbi:hypothetical protein GRJ2_001245500 [Grus japonensis]|uniref:Uncharacterized protein n=1 Tax=Grus japonensis TaxID=30415 RepID=A0ABC9WRS0_GRUJA
MTTFDLAMTNLNLAMTTFDLATATFDLATANLDLAMAKHVPRGENRCMLPAGQHFSSLLSHQGHRVQAGDELLPT